MHAPGLLADLTQNADGTYVLTFNNGLAEHFSSGGQFISVSDRHGNTEHFGYGGDTGGSCPSGLIGTITDTVGRATNFGCANGLVTSVTDADNRVVRYGYDANNNLTSFTDRAGGVTTYQYNQYVLGSQPVSLPVTITDTISNQTVITYDVGPAQQRKHHRPEGRGHLELRL